MAVVESARLLVSLHVRLPALLPTRSARIRIAEVVCSSYCNQGRGYWSLTFIVLYYNLEVQTWYMPFQYSDVISQST